MSETTTVHVDAGKCKAYGICVNILPDVFDLPARASAAVLLTDRVEEPDFEDLDEAVRSCPAQAISRSDNAT